MGQVAFTQYLDSLRGTINSLVMTARGQEVRVQKLRQGTGGEHEAAKANPSLRMTEEDLNFTRSRIRVLKDYHSKVQKTWSQANDRVIGHVVWSPPLTGSMPPHSYTQDVCVIKLDKKKFRHFGGNVLSLGVRRYDLL